MSGQALFKKAIALHKQEKFDEAVPLYREVLRHNLNHIDAWHNLGSALRKTGQLEASCAALTRALELNPNAPTSLSSLGNCLRDLDLMERSLIAHARAYELDPKSTLIRKNYAIALRDFGHHEEALAHFEALRPLTPDDNFLQWDLGATYMYLGRFAQGWEALESRWQHEKMKAKVRHYDVPRWMGEDLTGKTILIYSEQGFGDTILCSRYIPLVKQRGARVILECKKNLHRLFSTIEGIDVMDIPHSQKGGFDYHTPMMSLPWVFKTDLNSIPPPARLNASGKIPAEAARLLDLSKGRLKVGIVWSGSVTFLDNRKRSVTAERFLPLAQVPGVQLYSLQKGPREKDLIDCGGQSSIIELGPHLDDFADTAAALKEIDLVIMTDSAVAHLAASLGTPVWNLLSFHAFWLYMTKREDSPWYPGSMRLLRQPDPGNWDAVFERVGRELAEMASS